MVAALDKASEPYRCDIAFAGVLALSTRQPLVSLALAVVACDLHLPWMNACKGASMVAFFLSGYNYSVAFGLMLSPFGLIFPLFPPGEDDAEGSNVWVDGDIDVMSVFTSDSGDDWEEVPRHEAIEAPFYPLHRGCLDLSELEESRAARMEHGSRVLAESTQTNGFGVLPVSANGECFVRVLAVQLDDDTFHDNCTLLYVLAIEALVKERVHFQALHGEALVTQQERAACVEKIDIYAPFRDEITDFDIYCLDKLEGAFEARDGLRGRHWCDVLEISALLKVTGASTYICAMTANHEDRFFNGAAWVDIDATASPLEVCDFLLLHWDDDTFQHYDAVFSKSTGDVKRVPDSVRCRFVDLHLQSDLCQAFLSGDIRRARATFCQNIFGFSRC